MSEAVDFNDNSEKIQKMVLASLFAALIAVGSYIRIPVGPIPITLQTFFVLLAAVTLGRKWGVVSIIVYLLVGFIGFPVFTGGSGGIGILFGPTGGYLYSFVLVAYLVGLLSEKLNAKLNTKLNAKSIPLFIISIFIISALGSFLILGIGTIHLAVFTGHDIYPAIFVGFIPFVIGDLIKSMAVALISPIVRKKFNRV
jgi:Uncharacterized conserved protein